MTDSVRELVSRLPLTGFSRLSAKSWIPSYLTREEQIARLVAQYSDAFDRLLDALRRTDLIDVLASLRMPLGDRVVELTNLWGAAKPALQQAVRAIFVDGWLPRAEGDTPTDPISTRFVVRAALPLGSAVPIVESESIDRTNDEGLPVFERIVGRSPSDVSGLERFQREAIGRLRDHFVAREPRDSPPSAQRGILCLPTGGGKTRTALEFLLEYFIGKQRVLWIAHRLELIDQVHQELRLLGAQRPEGTSFSISRVQGDDRDLRGDVVIASNATLLQQRPARSALDSSSLPLGIVVFDEGHHAVADQTWRYLEQLIGDDVHLLSLTATPFRTERGGTERLRALLGDVVHEQSFRSLVEEGFLAEPIFVRQVLRSTASFSLTAMEQKALERSDDFSAETLRRIAGTAGRDEEIVEHWQRRRNEFDKTIVFACDIEHAEQLTRRFQETAAAKSIHSGLSRDERQQRLKWFREQTRPCVLVNVGILTEGTNIPDVRCVLVARPTMSKALFHQMIGRGSRGPKTVPGKTHFSVIDCVDGYEHLGAVLAGAGFAAEFRSDAVLDSDGETDAREAVGSPPRGVSVARAAPTPSATAEIDVWTASLAATYAWHRDAGRAIDDLVPAEELSGNAADGRIAVPLFDAVLPVVAQALDLLRAAISQQRWADAYERRSALDALGAIRPTQWDRIVAHAKASGRAPVQVGVRSFADHTSAVAKLSVDPLLALLRRCDGLAENARRVEVEAAFAAHPTLAVFATVAALDATVVELLEDRRARTPAAEPDAAESLPSPGAAEAFVVLAAAVARADGHWIEAEHSVASKAVEQQFGRPISREFGDIEAVPSDEAALAAAVQALLATLSWAARSVVFDWLCRVAIADEQLHREEERVLLSLGAALGLSPDDVDRRIGWTLDRDPNSIGARADGRIACAVCSSVMVADAAFCGNCGASLRGGAVDDKSCPCPRCGTRMPADSTSCAVCGDTTDRPSAAAADGAGSGTQPDWAAGARAEEYVRQLLERIVQSHGASCYTHDRSPVAGEQQRGETDFKITRGGAPTAGDRREWDLHIEVKHLKSPATGAVYWSQREVEKAERLRAQRVAYFVVVAVPREDPEQFDLYWSTDPLEDLLRDTRRSLLRTDTFTVGLHATEGWLPDKPVLGPPTSTCTFEIRFEGGGLQHWRHDSATQIAPVEEWFDEHEGRSVVA